MCRHSRNNIGLTPYTEAFNTTDIVGKITVISMQSIKLHRYLGAVLSLKSLNLFDYLLDSNTEKWSFIVEFKWIH